MGLPEVAPLMLRCCTFVAAGATSGVAACCELYCSSPDCQVSTGKAAPRWLSWGMAWSRKSLQQLGLACRCPQYWDWIPGQPAS